MKPLKPVMAALLAASSATFALPGISYANDQSFGPGKNVAAPPVSLAAPAKADCPPADTETNPINILSCMIAKNPAARKDVGERLARFLQSKDASGGRYLTSGLQADKKALPAVLKMANDWPEANKANPGRVATLYFVIGPDETGLPAWAQTPLLKKFVPKMIWSDRLGIALANREWTGTKQIPQSGAAEATAAFLEDAADWAQKVFDDSRDKGDLTAWIGAHDTTAVVVPTSPPVTSPSNPLESTGSGFSQTDLYETGAKVQDVYGPNDSSGFRTLSVKIYTAKDGDGNNISRIGIVDITKSDISSPSVPQFIDITGASENVITMRDGGRQYKVTVDAQGNVSVTRPGGTVGVDGNGSLSTSIDFLQRKRNDQIMSCGLVSIGGQPYYVLGQGGATGSYLFFAQDQMLRDQAAHAAHPDSAQPDEVPSLSGDVVKALLNGSTAAITGSPDLGVLPDGTKWHLEFDMTQRMWKVKKGAGDSKDDPKSPKKPKPSKPGGGTTDPPSGSTGTAGGGEEPDPATGGTDGSKTLEDVVALAKKNGVWAESAGNNGFDAATRAQVRIMTNKATDGTKQYNVLFDPTLGVNTNGYKVAWQDPSIRTLGMRGVGKYIMLSYAVNQQKSYYYYDLANFVKYVKADKDNVPEPSGSYSNTGDAAINKAKDIVIVDDVLTKIMSVKADDPMIAGIAAHLKGHLKEGQQYTISGKQDHVVLVIGESSWEIWPGDKESGDKGTNAGMTGLRGPGTAITLVGGTTEQFRDDVDMGSGRVAHRVLLTADRTAALYTGTEDENVDGKIVPAEVSYVMLNYMKNSIPSRTKMLPVFGGKDRFKVPAGVRLEGLAAVELTDNGQLVMLRGSTQEKGAIVAVKHSLPSENLKDSKENCGGTVLWWGQGLTKEKVQAACEGDGKLP